MRKAVELTKNLLQSRLLARRFYWKLPAGDRVALTFDDGPDPQQTPTLLELLSRHGVTATFFVIGDLARRHPGVLRDIVSAGHALGSHTQSHRELPQLDAAELARELLDSRRTLQDIAGVDVTLVRPPRGKLDARSLWRVPALGFRIVHWSVTYSDYLRDGAQALLGRMAARPPLPCDIVLLHDIIPDTTVALESSLPRWVGEGVKFARLDDQTLGIP
jgi:peptidoglycan/xylan/chitin deacetylase (PgdA/CDA1 family)